MPQAQQPHLWAAGLRESEDKGRSKASVTCHKHPKKLSSPALLNRVKEVYRLEEMEKIFVR